MSLYIDLTEFLTEPSRTGVQRVAGEICKHAPPGSLTLLRLWSGRYFAFPPALLNLVAEYFATGSESKAADVALLSSAEKGTPVAIAEHDTVLVPEVFFATERLRFFRNIPDDELRRYRFIIHDLLPVTHPEYFVADMPLPVIYSYFQLLRRAPHCAFVSKQTRDVFYGRFKRTQDHRGVVLPLGSDALGPRPSRVDLDRAPVFTAAGTIEPRKNHDQILEAFAPLLRQIDGLTLHFVGKLGWCDGNLADKINTLASDLNSGFQFHSETSDSMIKTLIQQSRATIYLSSAEGYGLPPVESLWLGTPVIASSMVPSLQSLASGGIHYVDPITPLNLRRAVVSFLDDEYARRRIKEAMNLTLATWQSFTAATLAWCGYKE